MVTPRGSSYRAIPMTLLRRALPLLSSLGVHAAVIALFLGLAALPDLGYGAGEEDLGGDASGPAELVPEGDDLDFGPATVQLVSIGIVDDVAAPPVSAAAPLATAPVAATVPHPAPPPPDAVPAPEAPKPTEPAPEPPPAPPVPAPAVAATEPTENPEGADPNATPAPEAVADATPAPNPAANPHKQGKGRIRGQGRKATGKGAKTDCPVNPKSGVTKLTPTSWTVQRDIVEFYAGHLKELMKLGSVRPNRTPAGKLDGFRVGVAKCSLLRDTGFRTGDVVQTINGLEVHDLFAAIGAYLKLRKEKHFEVHLTRRGKPMMLSYDLD